LRQKVAQLVNVWVLGDYLSTASAEFDVLDSLVSVEGIGGITISVGLPNEYAAKLNALQRRAGVPLLVTSDLESGGPGNRLAGIYSLPHMLAMGGGTMFPPTMAFGAIGDARYAYELGRITGLEARAVGVHLTFAPVLDVNSNPANPIINTRSFGEDPERVADLGVVFIRGAKAAGLMTAAKHFPGHGDTRTDSHLELPVINATRARLDTLELVPFKRAVAAGVDAIMTAHIATPNILGSNVPATLSPYYLSGLLRDEYGFDGLIFTDALRMRAIVDDYGVGESAVLAIEAGADVILMPADIRTSIDALVEAVKQGRLSESRIDRSIERLLKMKVRAGLQANRFVDSDGLMEIVGRREHVAFADSAAQLSITMPRDDARLVPIDTTVTRRVLSIVYARREDPAAGRTFNSTLADALETVGEAWVFDGTTAAAYDSLLLLADAYDRVFVSVYVSPAAEVGTVGVSNAFARFVADLAFEDQSPVVLSFGSPYLLTAFPDAGTYLLAWGGREVSQRAAARALLGEAGISGRLPISLPPFHRIGDGLSRPAGGGG
jgi:beta-N-acetylhexosaminidase